jgi:hypothetical protein
MAQKGDDGPMIMMLEECKHDKEELALPTPTMEIVNLVEEKVFLHDKRGTKTGDNVWCLNTGASNHMTDDMTLFSELNLSVGGTVHFGDGATVSIAGQGNVLLELQSGHKVLTSVYYVPKLERNIISLGQLRERGCKIVLEEKYLWGYDHQRQLIMKVERSKNRLYYLDLDQVDPICDGFLVEEQRSAPLPVESTHVSQDIICEREKSGQLEGSPASSRPPWPEGGRLKRKSSPKEDDTSVRRQTRYACLELLNLAVTSITEGCMGTEKPEISTTFEGKQTCNTAKSGTLPRCSARPKGPEAGGPEGRGSPGGAEPIKARSRRNKGCSSWRHRRCYVHRSSRIDQYKSNTPIVCYGGTIQELI